MKTTIHSSEWADLLLNGAHNRGRFYKMDPDHVRYTVFDLSREKMPKNLHEPPTPPPKREYNRLYYEQRKQRRASGAKQPAGDRRVPDA